MNMTASTGSRRPPYPVTTAGSGTSSGSDYEQLGYDAASNVTSRRLRDGQVITPMAMTISIA